MPIKTLTARQAANRVAKGEGVLGWKLQGADRHVLTGGYYSTRELAAADPRLAQPEFVTYAPVAFLLVKGTYKYATTGMGRAGGDIVLTAKTVYATEVVG